MRWLSEASKKPRRALAAYIMQPRDDGGSVDLLECNIVKTA